MSEILAGWEASGVTRFVTGDPLNPTCWAAIASRCEWAPGQSLFFGYDPNWDFTLARRLPVKIGRGGNVRIQVQFYNVFNQVEFNTMNVSMTFSGVNATGGFGGNNTGANTGKYTSARNPFNAGVTIRFDY